MSKDDLTEPTPAELELAQSLERRIESLPHNSRAEIEAAIQRCLQMRGTRNQQARAKCVVAQQSQIHALSQANPIPGTAGWRRQQGEQRASRREERRVRLWELGGGTIGAILGSRYAMRVGDSRIAGSVAGGAAGGLLGNLVDRLLAR